MNETKETYHRLIKEVSRHDHLYFVENSPEITDVEYDKLYRKLVDIETVHPDWIISTSPTQRLSEPLRKGFKQQEHVAPMLSIDNTYSREEIEEWVKRVHKLLEKKEVWFNAELKVDGASVSVRYEKGILVRGLTRGDGKKGDDITKNIRTISAIPLELTTRDPPDALEIRGEIFMSHKMFETLNKEKEENGEELWANPRNAAAGSLKLLDPREVSKRGLSAVFYAIVEDSSQELEFQSDVSPYLKKLGLPVFDEHHRKKCDDLEEIMKYANRIEKLRDALPFDIDGIVIKVDQLKWHGKLGTTGKSPRWAVAYKFAPEQATTKIKDITVQVGRTGVLTPVAELEPVFLSGSTIARATLHNQEEIERKDIRVGDWAIIEKGGDVIPKVVEVDIKRRSHHSSPWKMPKTCPSCGSHVVHSEDEVAIRCPNSKSCPEQISRRIAFFASKDAMDIEHMGEKVVEQLVSKKLVKKLSDIYRLSEDDLAKLEGFKAKSIRNLLDSINESRHCTLARFILALGIRYVGEETAEELAKAAKKIDVLSKMDENELKEIEGVGDKVASAVVSYFKEAAHLDEIHELLRAGVNPEPPKVILHKDPAFDGKVFVITGTLTDFTRDEATRLIKQKGGKVTGSVTKNTDFLLVGEDPGSKFDKARELHIKTLTEEQFKKML